MQRVIPMVCAALVPIALGVSGWQENQRVQTAEAVASDWVACGAKPGPDCGDPLWWNHRIPPTDPVAGLALAAKTESHAWFATGAGQEVWAVDWASRSTIGAVPTDAIDTVALSTAALVGMEISNLEGRFNDTEHAVLASLEPWHSELRDRCGTCAPPSQAYPAIMVSTQPSVIAPPGIDAPSIDLAAERLRRSAQAPDEEAPPLVELIAHIRDGALPPASVWSEKGKAGMVALELARAGQGQALDDLLIQLEQAPSSTDRVAMIYAALRLFKDHPSYVIPPNADAHLGAVATRRLRSLPGAP